MIKNDIIFPTSGTMCSTNIKSFDNLRETLNLLNPFFDDYYLLGKFISLNRLKTYGMVIKSLTKQ